MTGRRPTIPVRAHTALCMQGFVGRGYSEEFAQNMQRIIDLLHNGTEIQLTAGPDRICGACPHGQTNGCRLHDRDNEAHIVDQDHAVLRALQLPPNSRLSWSTLVERVGRNIKPSDLDSICGGCPWLPMGMCRDALQRIQLTDQQLPPDHLQAIQSTSATGSVRHAEK